MKNIIYNFRAEAHLGEALGELDMLEQRLVSPQSRFAVPFVFRGKGHYKTIKPRHNPYEIEGLYREVCDLLPSRVLEIGTAKGGSLYLWCQAAAADAQIVSVDLPGGEFGGGYIEQRTPLYKRFARSAQSIHLLRENSQSDEALEKVKGIFGGDAIDFAFIDGDHTFEGVKKDFEMYGPLVRPGGLIGFHDTLPRPPELNIHVDKFWNLIKDQYESTEFVGPNGSGKIIGTGLIKVPASGILPVGDK